MKGRVNALEKEIEDWIESNREPGLRLLRELVQTPSYSGREGTAADPASVAGRVFAAASTHGSHVESQVVAPQSENVIEVLNGPGRRTVILEAHTDTVPEGDARLWHGGRPFSGAEGYVEYLGDRRVAVEVDSGRYEAPIRDRMARVWDLRKERRLPIVYGRGSFDNKGPVVSTVLAMGALAAAVKATGSQLGGTVIAAYTVDEETSTTGIQRFACGPDSWLGERGFLDGPVAADGFLQDVCGIAMDGSYGWIPIVGHRGSAQFELRTHGRSAHAATPQLGANATELMSMLLLQLRRSEERMGTELLESLEASLLGPPTFAIGTTIVGGGIRTVQMTEEGPRVDRTGVNAIPNWCLATIDVRFPPAHDLALADTVRLIKDVLETALRDVQLADAGWSWELEVLGSDPPVALARNFEEAARHPLVRVARARAAEVLGFEPHLETAPGGTDATFMIHEGRIPTLVEFGPAGALSHDAHEYVEVDSVIAGARILALTTLDILGLAEKE
jgi:acetylornithine deacetylase/succinyl-diaminopimelate desuccinylase-like protein